MKNMLLILFVIQTLFMDYLCADLNICTTPNGSSGLCITKDLCPSLLRREKTNSTEDFSYIKESICDEYDGYTFNVTYCCGVKTRPESEANFTAQVVTKAHPGFLGKYIQEEKVLICRTPNGEAGECVSIYKCDTFLKLITGEPKKLTAEVKQFIRASECKKRKVNESPMVCCGDDITFKKH